MFWIEDKIDRYEREKNPSKESEQRKAIIWSAKQRDIIRIWEKKSIRDYDRNKLIIQEKFESGCVIIIWLTFLMSPLLLLRWFLLLVWLLFLMQYIVGKRVFYANEEEIEEGDYFWKCKMWVMCSVRVMCFISSIFAFFFHYAHRICFPCTGRVLCSTISPNN